MILRRRSLSSLRTSLVIRDERASLVIPDERSEIRDPVVSRRVGRRSTVALAVGAALTMSMAGCGGSDGSSTNTAAELEKRGTEDPASTTTTALPRATGVPDPCALLTPADVSSALGSGSAVSAGLPSGTGQSCSFPPVGSTDGARVLLTISGDDTHDKFVDARRNAGASGPETQDLAGVGDEAFVYAPASGVVQSAESRLGTIRVRVVVSGQTATTQMAQGVLKAAATKITG